MFGGVGWQILQVVSREVCMGRMVAVVVGRFACGWWRGLADRPDHLGCTVVTRVAQSPHGAGTPAKGVPGEKAMRRNCEAETKEQ